MASIMIRVTGFVPTGSHAVEVAYEVLPDGASAAFHNTAGEPFVGDPNGINVGIIGSAKAVSAANGFPVNEGDTVLLFGGITPVSFGGSSPQLAHVVMHGDTVDSAFVGTSAESAARARADALAEATAGLAQDDARKAAPWIATAPVNPG